MAEPLPPLLLFVAKALLVVYGGLFVLGALYVVCGFLAVILMPMIMGRDGVGRAMITLFTVCVTFVTSGILLLAARSAARVVRREPGSVRTLSLFALWSLCVVLVAGAITQWLSVAFFSVAEGGELSFDWTIPVRMAELVFAAFFLWAAVVLRRFDQRSRAAR